MAVVKIELRYGINKLIVKLKDKNFAGLIRPKRLLVKRNWQSLIMNALKNPIKSTSLDHLVEKDDKVAFLVSDITRPCPSRILIPPLVKELRKIGVKYDNMSIVFATGTHRSHTWKEKISLVGSNIASKIKLYDHNCRDENIFKYLGKTSRGTEVEINRFVLNHDFVIGIANIDLHWFVGYSGGSKSLMPGVASFNSIVMNHSLMLQPGAEPGKITGNPVREDIEEASSMGKLDFIINVILNEEKEIVKVVAGDPIKAHRAGIPVVDEMYKVELQEKADIVIASAGGFPKDINLYQAQKALDNAFRAVKDYGVIILVAECRDGLGGENTPFKKWLLEASKPEDIIERIKSEFVLGGHKAYGIAKVAIKHKIILVSSLSDEDARRAFMIPKRTLKEALNEAFNYTGRDASIIVMPYAGYTLPITSK